MHESLSLFSSVRRKNGISIEPGTEFSAHISGGPLSYVCVCVFGLKILLTSSISYLPPLLGILTLAP